MDRDRVVGMFLGVAIGDALGMPLEMLSAESIEKKFGRVTTLLKPGDDHKFFAGKPAGYWTDDTALTLAIAKSLINKGCVDMDDIAKEHIKAFDELGDRGYGNSTKFAIRNLKNGVHWSKSAMTGRDKRGLPYGTGNGIAMKVAPLAVWYEYTKKSPYDRAAFDNLTRAVRDISFMTHKTGMAVASGLAQVCALNLCFSEDPRFYTRDFDVTFTYIVHDVAKIGESMLADEFPEKLSDRFKILMDMRGDDFLTPNIRKTFDNGTCFVYNSLPFTYSFFVRNPLRGRPDIRNIDDDTHNIKGLYDVANAGGDTDSNASMLGALLGALRGTNIFPDHLVNGLWRKDEILSVANKFCDRFDIK